MRVGPGVHSERNAAHHAATGVSSVSLLSFSATSSQAVPDDAHLKGSLLDFDATYVKTAGGLKVVRAVHDKAAQTICPPELVTEFKKQSSPLTENLRTQVLYRRKP